MCTLEQQPTNEYRLKIRSDRRMHLLFSFGRFRFLFDSNFMHHDFGRHKIVIRLALM